VNRFISRGIRVVIAAGAALAGGCNFGPKIVPEHEVRVHVEHDVHIHLDRRPPRHPRPEGEVLVKP
jgi:hypothetical protein